jgi:hypothetical protein
LGPDGSASADSSVPPRTSDNSGASPDRGVGDGSGPSGLDGSASADSSGLAGAGDGENRGRASADPGGDVGPDPSGSAGASGAVLVAEVPGAASLANLISRRLMQDPGSLSMRTNFPEELLSLASTAMERESLCPFFLFFFFLLLIILICCLFCESALHRITYLCVYMFLFFFFFLSFFFFFFRVSIVAVSPPR